MKKASKKERKKIQSDKKYYRKSLRALKRELQRSPSCEHITTCTHKKAVLRKITLEDFYEWKRLIDEETETEMIKRNMLTYSPDAYVFRINPIQVNA